MEYLGKFGVIFRYIYTRSTVDHGWEEQLGRPTNVMIAMET